MSACPDAERVRSESYSLGVTLYYAVTGELPFEASTPDETCRLQLESAPTSLIERAPHLERYASFLRVVHQCMERSALARPDSLDSLGSLLGEALREAQRLENSSTFFPLRVSEARGIEPRQSRGYTEDPLADTAQHNRRQIMVLIALVGLLLGLIYYQSASPILGVEDAAPVVVPDPP